MNFEVSEPITPTTQKTMKINEMDEIAFLRLLVLDLDSKTRTGNQSDAEVIQWALSMIESRLAHALETVSRDEKLVADLAHVVNVNSRENGSNTPDFALGLFLAHAIKAFDQGVNKRSSYYGGTD